jgi:hypothetical protein
MRSLVLAAFFVIACAGAPRPSPSHYRPSDVIELAALPPGFEAGDSVSASCSGHRGFRAIDDEPLGDVDCSEERLSRALRARAAAAASRFVIGKACRTRGRERYSARCSATLAVRGSSVALGAEPLESTRPAVSPGQVLDLDEPLPLESAQIQVSFTPLAEKPALSARAYDRVAELAELPVGRSELGQVSARCPSCEPLSLHHALRVTAGRVGASEVARVRCFRDGGDERCVATAVEPWSF